MKKQIRVDVYNKYGGRCAYCGLPIKYANMQVDHIIPKFNGGTDYINNLNPSCRRCNHYKRSMSLEFFRHTIKTLHKRIKQIYICKVGYDFGVIRHNEWDGLFYFEKYKQEQTKKIIKPKIVCLCSSTRFMDAFFEAGWEFTLRGWIVLSVGVCKHAEHHGAEALGQDVANRLDELHLRKIDMADLVHVLDVDGYIGESTRKEIDYAEKLGKKITYLSEEQ